MTAATRGKRLEDALSLVFGLSLATAVWQPNHRWPMWIAFAALAVSFGIRPFVDTEADRQRRRRSLWVVPVVIAAFAVQLAWAAAEQGTMRTIYLSVFLVLAGLALYVQRRRGA